jgi:dienelactone hydrolase
MRRLLAPTLVVLMATGVRADELQPQKGTVTFKPIDAQQNVPVRYRLGEYTFAYDLKPKFELPNSGVDVYHLTFPSPVKCKHDCNNTVHAEYYRPKGNGPFPAVIVLDVMAGDQKLSRGICTLFAQNNIAGLFVQMAYYGPRRPTTERVRLLSSNIPHTMDAIRQTVLDCRCAAAWLESRPEVDPKRLGILGTSLGSFMSALTAQMEPRLGRVALLLSGGGLVDAYWDHPRAKPLVALNNLLGGRDSKEKLKRLIAPADPLTNAGNLKDRKLLMIAASRDDIVPPKAARTLWEATGKQKIIWFDATHVGAALYIFDAIDVVLEHFTAE